jgi:hypothetical protein
MASDTSGIADKDQMLNRSASILPQECLEKVFFKAWVWVCQTELDFDYGTFVFDPEVNALAVRGR